MRLKSHSGQALVEFVLVLPILLILTLAIAELSILLYDKAVITNAAREGARFGIVSQPTRYTLDDIRPVVEAYCNNNLITFGGATNVNVAADYTAQTFGNPLKVTVTYNFQFLALPNFIGTNGGITLKSESIMKYE